MICANEQQWAQVEAVARQAAGEPVIGALRSLIKNIYRQLVVNKMTLSNKLLERSPVVHSLIDGVDATLVDLASSEIGEEELVHLATQIVDQTLVRSKQTMHPSNYCGTCSACAPKK